MSAATSCTASPPAQVSPNAPPRPGPSPSGDPTGGVALLFSTGQSQSSSLTAARGGSRQATWKRGVATTLAVLVHEAAPLAESALHGRRHLIRPPRVPPGAPAAPTHPRAPPEQLGSSPPPSEPASGRPTVEEAPLAAARCLMRSATSQCSCRRAHLARSPPTSLQLDVPRRPPTAPDLPRPNFVEPRHDTRGGAADAQAGWGKWAAIRTQLLTALGAALQLVESAVPPCRRTARPALRGASGSSGRSYAPRSAA